MTIKSSFGGHIINLMDPNDASITSDRLFESYSAEQKNNVQTKLRSVGIVEFEQVYAISNTSSRNNLKDFLEISENDFQKLIDTSSKIIGEEKLGKLAPFKFDYELGALPPDPQLLTESLKIDRVEQVTGGVKDEDLLFALVRAQTLVEENLSKVSEYDSKTCSFHNFIPIKNQGKRGTCVAFSVTAANEFYHKRRGVTVSLSEQHLYYQAKQLDGNDTCGTTVTSAIKAISLAGQCREKHWKYTPNSTCNNHGTKGLLVDQDSRDYIAACLQLNSRDIDVFKSAIISEGLISFSIPIYKSFVDLPETTLMGRVIMPLPNEAQIGWHAMTIVGFENDINYPGGGYFIFRNSWGKTWASASPYLSGHGIIPYQYITDHCSEAFTLIFPQTIRKFL